MMECAGMSQPLFIVTGSCQGIQISLDQDSIPFGAVVQGSTSKRRFIMQNNGDIGAGYVKSWFVSKRSRGLRFSVHNFLRINVQNKLM